MRRSALFREDTICLRLSGDVASRLGLSERCHSGRRAICVYHWLASVVLHVDPAPQGPTTGASSAGLRSGTCALQPCRGQCSAGGFPSAALGSCCSHSLSRSRSRVCSVLLSLVDGSPVGEDECFQTVGFDFSVAGVVQRRWDDQRSLAFARLRLIRSRQKTNQRPTARHWPKPEARPGCLAGCFVS